MAFPIINQLENDMIRTRFAPSPTGFLHIGGARTALYCWLYARKMNGTFILRIEDTDLERSTPESVQAILEGMRWLGLDYQEGPFYQTERFSRYQEVMALLLKEGKAYRCYCSKERLEKLREAQTENKEKPRYDGFCRDREAPPDAGPFVVRFKNPQTGVVEFDDLIRGKLVFNNSELDDLIIARTDGTPTYNFTVVVDDWDMKITHVLRGDDHINNTPRQINILRALAADLPEYAHLPMILGSDGKRLSKRHGAVSVMQYREEGFLPAALLNYLARLGWSHGDQEIFSIEELVRYFEIKEIHRSPAALNMDKLLWLNQHYIKQGGSDVLNELAWHMNELGIDTSMGPPLAEIIQAQAERAKTLKEMAEKSRYFFETVVLSQEIKEKHFSPALQAVIEDFRDRLLDMAEWSKEAIHTALNTTAEQHGLKLGKLAQPIRVAVTGGTVSPPIDLTLFLLGRERVVERINQIY